MCFATYEQIMTTDGSMEEVREQCSFALAVMISFRHRLDVPSLNDVRVSVVAI